MRLLGTYLSCRNVKEKSEEWVNCEKRERESKRLAIKQQSTKTCMCVYLYVCTCVCGHD